MQVAYLLSNGGTQPAPPFSFSCNIALESPDLQAGRHFVDETENGTEDIWWFLEGLDYPRLWREPFK